MAGYITYFPKEQIKTLEKDKDYRPIKVIFGSIHTKMPSIQSVKIGDIIYPVTIMNGNLYAIARLPVENIEIAYDYLVRELGNSCGALVPDGIDWKTYYYTPLLPHKKHQEPFNCCAKLAATSTSGSTIESRQIPNELLEELRFGPSKSKEKGLRFDKNGKPSILSVSSVVRKMSEETQKIFEALFV